MCQIYLEHRFFTIQYRRHVNVCLRPCTGSYTTCMFNAHCRLKCFFFTFVNTFLTLEFYVLQNAFKYFVVNNMGRYIFKINAAFSYDSTAS